MSCTALLEPRNSAGSRNIEVSVTLCMAYSHCETNPMQNGRIIHNRRGNARLRYHSGTFVQPMLLWKSNEYYIFRECAFVAIVIRHAMRCPILSSVTCLSRTYISTLSHSRYDFREKVTERKMFVLIFSTGFVWNISHSKKNWARYDKKKLY